MFVQNSSITRDASGRLAKRTFTLLTLLVVVGVHSPDVCPVLIALTVLLSAGCLAMCCGAALCGPALNQVCTLPLPFPAPSHPSPAADQLNSTPPSLPASPSTPLAVPPSTRQVRKQGNSPGDPQATVVQTTLDHHPTCGGHRWCMG